MSYLRSAFKIKRYTLVCFNKLNDALEQCIERLIKYVLIFGYTEEWVENAIKNALQKGIYPILINYNSKQNFSTHIKNILNKRVSVYYGKDYESVITKIAEEIDNRYKLFPKNKVKNIVEYNKTIGNLQRIALIIDCELTDFIKRESTEKCFYEILSKGWAAGLFTCLFSTSELKSKSCFSDILGLIPFSADYYEYEHAYAMLQNDEKFKQAIKFATITRVVNATKLQQKLKIGCSRAEKYVETMQNLGIIGRNEFYTLRTES